MVHTGPTIPWTVCHTAGLDSRLSHLIVGNTKQIIIMSHYGIPALPSQSPEY
jgi:hypothetical protein